MRNKLLALLLGTTMVLSLVACGQTEVKESEKSEVKQEESKQEESKEESKEEVKEEEVNKDDVEIEIFIVNPWAQQPIPEGDPYEAYVEETFGGDWSLTLAADGENELFTRFLDTDAPDYITFGSVGQLNKLYEEGMLIEDWNQYADMIPRVLENMGDTQISYLSEDGKLKGLSGIPGGQNWGWMIRQDWLDALKLDMPTNADQLLDVLKAFTFNDPDGNGEDDTWGLSIAGQNGLGDFGHLIKLFGDPGYFVKDGKATHSIVEGTYKEFLDLAKAILDAGVIDPDWYGLSWDNRKPGLYAGKYGMVYYPPFALLNETATGGGAETMATAWTVFDGMGKATPAAVKGDLFFTVSAEAAEDPAKMEIICDYLNRTAGVSDEYVAIRYGSGIESMNGHVRNDDGSVYVWQDVDGSSLVNQCGYFGWGQSVYNQPSWLVATRAKDPDLWTTNAMALNSALDALDRWSSNGDLLILDGTIGSEAGKVQNQFAIQYIMGETDDYEGFVEEWLTAGGQLLLDDAQAQFDAMGLTK